VLFQTFFEEMRNRLRPNSSPFARPWNEAFPRTTPDGLADPSAAVAALVEAARKVEATHGRLDVAWGEVYRLRRGDADLPANGGPGALGIFRVVGYSGDEDGRFRAVVGDSFVAAVEFSNPLRASVLIGYGNASQPGSPHLTDQLPLFSRKELRPAWRTRPEIEAHLEAREVF
jgi:acyl-homoserine-lactone acylase